MASAVHKNIEPKVAAVNANSVCRQLSQNTAEQELRMSLSLRFSGLCQYES